MTNEEIIKGLQAVNEHIGKHFNEGGAWMAEFIDNAIKALEQESITWIVGKDNCQVAVRNMPIDKMQKICGIIGEEEREPKTGKWEYVQYDYNPNLGNWHCSECRNIVIECVNKNDKGGIPIYKYCPNCGAKMEVII